MTPMKLHQEFITNGPIFVIQIHDAEIAGLHYDLRLESNGVLLSWVLRKKPPISRGVKRLAIPVVDHLLNWANFTGEIKHGYGKGTVTIYDREVVHWEKTLPPLIFNLSGTKIKGRYTLLPYRGNFLFYKLNRN